MATKKAATKKPCHILQINSDGSITPPLLKLKHKECIRLLSPTGLSVDMKLVITLTAGGGGPITVHS